MSPSATVLVTSKNRKNELRTALTSALSQTAPIEVLVIDDGSTDGTTELVRSEFPSVRLISHAVSRGLIVRRNEGAKLASAPIVVSIDDDAAFPSPRTVEQTLREFNHPKIGAVAIPFINVNQDSIVRQKAPDGDNIWIADRYIGTAHAIRRDVFLRLGGYREHFIHQGEEGDYCLRMLAAGYVVRLGTADPIHHFESPRRSFERMDYYGRRNDILFAWHNVPLVALPIHLAGTILNGLRQAFRVRRYRKNLAGQLGGVLWCCLHFRNRAAVPSHIYWLGRKLKKQGATRLEIFKSFGFL